MIAGSAVKDGESRILGDELLLCSEIPGAGQDRKQDRRGRPRRVHLSWQNPCQVVLIQLANLEERNGQRVILAVRIAIYEDRSS